MYFSQSGITAEVSTRADSDNNIDLFPHHRKLHLENESRAWEKRLEEEISILTLLKQESSSANLHFHIILPTIPLTQLHRALKEVDCLPHSTFRQTALTALVATVTIYADSLSKGGQHQEAHNLVGEFLEGFDFRSLKDSLRYQHYLVRLSISRGVTALGLKEIDLGVDSLRQGIDIMMKWLCQINHWNPGSIFDNADLSCWEFRTPFHKGLVLFSMDHLAKGLTSQERYECVMNFLLVYTLVYSFIF